MNETRKRLSDILCGSDRERLENAWKSRDAAPEMEALPPGECTALPSKAEPFKAKTGTPGYRFTFWVIGPAE